MAARMFPFVIKNSYHKLPSLEKLKEHYFYEKMSLSEIAKLYGSSKAAIRLRFQRNNINRRTLKESWEIIGNHIELTPKAIEELDGFLLGDGCLVPHNMISASYTHTDNYPQYIKWLRKHLSDYGLEITIPNENRLDSKSYRELYDQRLRWYPEGQKEIPPDLILTPPTLRNWYIGDGGYYKGYNNTKKGETVMIYCTKLKPELLYPQFKELEIPVTKYKKGLYIPAKNRRTFFEYITSDNPNIPPCYHYKLPKGFLI